MSKIHSLNDIIATAQRMRASDIHIVCGIPIRIRVDGKLRNLDTNVMTAEDCEAYAQELSNHYDEIKSIVSDPAKAEQMRIALHSVVVPDSAERVCAIMEKLIRR